MSRIKSEFQPLVELADAVVAAHVTIEKAASCAGQVAYAEQALATIKKEYESAAKSRDDAASTASEIVAKAEAQALAYSTLAAADLNVIKKKAQTVVDQAKADAKDALVAAQDKVDALIAQEQWLQTSVSRLVAEESHLLAIVSDLKAKLSRAL